MNNWKPQKYKPPMTALPQTLDEAISQAKAATLQALEDGRRLIQVELVFPEIALEAQKLAQDFIPILQEFGGQPKIFFPDTGAAALARRDWGETPFKVTDLGSSRSPIDNKIDPEDESFLVVNPSSVEVGQVERLVNLAGDRPIILLIPKLEDVAVVGIGYTARQLRERLLSQIYSCYYIRPLEGAALYRCHPHPWQVWLETADGSYTQIAEQPQKPVGEALDRILIRATTGENTEEATPTQKRRGGIFGELERFIKALTQ
nr:DUF1995 family protein [Roseofilum sp. Belize Diploria]